MTNRYGSSRNIVLPKPLEEGYFKLDNRNLEELMVSMLEISKELTFFHPKKKGFQDGTWDKFLENDISFILSDIITLNLKEINREFARKNELEDQKNYINTTLSKIYNWYEQLKKLILNPGEIQQKAKEELEIIINSKLENVPALIAGLDDENPTHSVQFIWQIIYTELAYLKERFRLYFEQSITQNENHPPQSALLIAYLKLFHQFFQHELNALPQQFLSFYYERILGLEKAKAQPDQVHICFEPAPHVRTKILPKGTQLIAGRNLNGTPIVYETSSNLELSKARIKAMKTLYFSNQGLDLKKPVYMASLDEALYAHPENLKQGVQAWPAFGEKPNRKEGSIMKPAYLGFAISSPLFFLKEGKRKINLQFDEPIAVPEDINNQQKIRISVDTREGWEEISVERYEIDQNKIKIELGESFPPIIPAEDQFGPWPVIQFLWPVSLDLGKLEKELKIDVEVKGIRNLRCYNELGLINTQQSFQPFGPLPEVGSTFIIGSEEAFQKPLTSFNLNLDWKSFDEKSASEFFKEYFKHYDKDLFPEIGTSEYYKVAIERLKDGVWENNIWPEPEQLLRNRIDSTPKLDWKTAWEFDPLVPYDNYAKEGYLKMTLKEPQSAFGKKAYQPSLSKVANELAKELVEKKQKKNGEELQYPNEPLTPILQRISIDYSASNLHKPNGSYEFFHIHPFGSEKIETPSFNIFPSIYSNKLDDRAGGYLWIGLENIRPTQELSIYFEFEKRTAFQIERASRETYIESNWYYLHSNQLSPLAVISDDTKSLSRSGIIKLKIPNINLENIRSTILDSDLFWVCVVAKGKHESFLKPYFIQLHVEKAVQSIKPFEELDLPLPPFSTAKAKKNIAGVKRIIQPFESTYGLSADNNQQYINRISRHLTHNNRIWQTSDCEQIILDQFPEVAQAKAFQEKDGLKVVVAPHRSAYQQNHTPSFTPNTLYEIKNVLRKYHSPFTQITVTNVHYAFLQMVAYIEFKEAAGFKQLINEFTDYLNPWRKVARQDMPIGIHLDVKGAKEWLVNHPEVSSIEALCFIIYHFNEDANGIASYLEPILSHNLDQPTRKQILKQSNRFKFKENGVIIVDKPSSHKVCDSMDAYKEILNGLIPENEVLSRTETFETQLDL